MPDRPREWDVEDIVPTAKQQKVIEALERSDFDLSRLEQFGREAGYPAHNARAAAVRAVRRLENNPKMQRALKKHGVTLDKLAEKIAEQLEAKHPLAPKMTDNFAVNKAIEQGLRIYDVNPSTKIDIDRREEVHVTIDASFEERYERSKQIQAAPVDVIDVVPDDPDPGPKA